MNDPHCPFCRAPLELYESTWFIADEQWICEECSVIVLKPNRVQGSWAEDKRINVSYEL